MFDGLAFELRGCTYLTFSEARFGEVMRGFGGIAEGVCPYPPTAIDSFVCSLGWDEWVE